MMSLEHHSLLTFIKNPSTLPPGTRRRDDAKTTATTKTTAKTRPMYELL